MKRIKIWLTSAVATTVTLALASSASAMHNARDPFNLGYGGTEPSPVVSHSSSFNWGVLAVAATFIVAAVLVATAVAYVGRNRTILATSH